MTTPQTFLSRISLFNSRFWRLTCWVSFEFGLIVGEIMAVAIFTSKDDTTQLGNAVMAVLAVLSGLSLTYAQCFPPDGESRERTVSLRAGGTLFLATFAVALAVMLKYGSSQVPDAVPWLVKGPLQFGLRQGAFFLFLVAVVTCTAGVNGMTGMLYVKYVGEPVPGWRPPVVRDETPVANGGPPANLDLRPSDGEVTGVLSQR